MQTVETDSPHRTPETDGGPWQTDSQHLENRTHQTETNQGEPLRDDSKKVNAESQKVLDKSETVCYNPSTIKQTERTVNNGSESGWMI